MGFPFSEVLSLGAKVLGPVLGYEGQKETNETAQAIASQATAASAAQAQRQMDFQDDMSRTGYQRAVTDMMKAGLNPMLAYQQGAAPTPPGAKGDVFKPEFKSPILGGLEGAYSAAQTQQVTAQRDLTVAQTTEAGARTVQALSSAGELDAVRDNIRQEMKSFEERMRKLGFETDVARVGAYRESARWNYVPETVRAEAEELIARARLVGLEIPEAVANAGFWSTVGAAGKGAQAGVDLARKGASMFLGRGIGLGSSAGRAAGQGLRPRGWHYNP